jgi:hypothetical protein
LLVRSVSAAGSLPRRSGVAADHLRKKPQKGSEALVSLAGLPSRRGLGVKEGLGGDIMQFLNPEFMELLR